MEAMAVFGQDPPVTTHDHSGRDTPVLNRQLKAELQGAVCLQVVAGPRFEPTTDGPNGFRPQLTFGSLLQRSGHQKEQQALEESC